MFILFIKGDSDQLHIYSTFSSESAMDIATSVNGKWVLNEKSIIYDLL